MKSHAVVQVGDRHLEMQELEVPRIGADEALLRVEACGLCGSDVEQFRGHFTQKGWVSYPLIPGHEPVGIIEEIGPEAARRWQCKAGDRVAVEPHISCGFCRRCLGGSYHLCKELAPPTGLTGYGFMPLDGGRGLWGGYAQYMHLQPRTVLHRVPTEMPRALASLYQSLAAGVRWAVQVPRTAIGDSILVLGCGQRGLGAVIAAREAGASTIIVTGLKTDRHKMDLALALGAQHAIVADEEDVVARVMAITRGHGVDVVLDVVPGAAHPTVQAVEVVRIGGTIVLAGLKGKDTKVALDTDRIVLNEITVHGVFSQGHAAYDQAIRLLAENRYDLGRLHTHSFGLERAEEAIRTLAGEQAGEHAISVSLEP
jgi:threonine dehydrogenase-like Zn-dependent dehydrogenase